MARALVVFRKERSGPLGWLLHPAFGHCFVCVDDGLYWTVIDSTDGKVFVKMGAHSEYDLESYYRGKGYVVMSAESGPGLRGPLTLVNCVSLCKAILGIRSWAITPYQFYKHLRKRNGSSGNPA